MLSIKEVRELVPLSARQIDRLVQKRMFPQPIFISPNRRVWREATVLTFLREREDNAQHKRNYSTKKKPS
jgi:predicted DNA-binding transcriptional regulator AlpA